MRTTIKDKTKLRSIVKKSIGNTGSLEYVEFYPDWSWEIMSSSTFSEECVHRCTIGSLASLDGYGETVDHAITQHFWNIQGKIGDKN